MARDITAGDTDRRYRQKEEKAVAHLPPEMAAIWRHKRSEVFLRPDHASKPRYQRRPRATGLWKPATACLYLHQTLRLIAIVRERMPTVPIRIPDLFSQDVVTDILTSDVFRPGSMTRVIFCRANHMVAWRIFDLQAPWLEHAYKNMRREACRRDHSARVLPRPVYEQIASDLAFALPDGYDHDVHSAISYRDAAIITCSLELAPRGHEIVSLRVEDVLPTPDADGLTVFIPASIRKAGSPVRGLLVGEAARIVGQYLHKARPVLLNGRADPGTLWLNHRAGPLSQESLRRILRLKLGKLCGAPCSSNIMRSLMASRTDIREEHLGRRLGHSGHSPLAYDLYPVRDMSVAHGYNQAMLRRNNDPPAGA
ncbi:site-specific integrase [Brytella acorum]|uniref:site-specific integrase n=1 Tax=Brytella acorum TaxID=2959299 RepID=UPI0025AE10A1|nr:site-specific integrase [Brytella acorum]MDF3626226.1 site-specific integrase [Brytella acorum]